MRFGLAAAAGWLLLALLLPTTVFAHANLERAEPASGTQLDQPPRQLQLFFSEAVDSSFSRVQLLNAQRDAVDRGDSHVAPNDPRSLLVSLPDQLPNGVYTVSWRTLSAVDGHTVNGAYPLIIGPMPAEGVAATAAASSRWSARSSWRLPRHRPPPTCPSGASLASRCSTCSAVGGSLRCGGRGW